MMQKTAPLLVSVCAAVTMTVSGTAANAVTLPAIKATSKNSVPSCATPGRLMSYLKDNNPRLRSKFANIATEYQRHGTRLGLRWDYAFFQMLVETGFLRFNGDVKWTQNNFAGLGATGGGVRGEKFRSVTDGVKAHLEHLSMYSGKYVENPTAERTRKIQEWKLLAKWQRQFKKRPMTFKDMASKWAPGSRGYPRDIEFVGERFYSGHCKRPDPQANQVIAARDTKKEKKPALKKATSAKTKARPNKTKTAKKDTAKPAPKKAGPTTSAKKTTKDNKPSTTTKEFKTASIAGAANQTAAAAKAKAPKPAKKATCRVWSASYGGTKAVIIKAVDKDIINYTVLKVNDGRQQPETKAYIHAYAKGGKLMDQFANPDQALEKAFQLCPEG